MKGPGKKRFDEVFTQGDQASKGCLRLHWLSGSGHLGVATSRAIGSHARRNRQKRRLRAAVASCTGEFQSHDMVFLVKAHASEVTWKDLLSQVQGLLSEVSRRGQSGSESP